MVATQPIVTRQKLRIAIAEDDRDHRELLVRTLERMGHDVVGAAESGRALMDLCQSATPDLIITDIGMPDMDGLEACDEICKISRVPVIIVTSHSDDEFISQAQLQHVLAFLVKPVTAKNLTPTIAVVLQRFAEFTSLKRENASLSQSLEDRKIIERAKGLLMTQAKLDEPAAFKRLQKLARDQRKKLVDIAQMVISAADLMKPE